MKLSQLLSAFAIATATSMAAAQEKAATPAVPPRLYTVGRVDREKAEVELISQSVRFVWQPNRVSVHETRVWLLPLASTECYDTQGKKVASEDALKRLASGDVVAISADAVAVSTVYLKGLAKETLVFVSPEYAVNNVLVPLNAGTEVGSQTFKSSAQPEAKAKPEFYTVDHYDDARNAADDLEKTITRAKAEKKNILIQVGGDWCGWCKLMTNFIDTNEAVRNNISTNFLLMKVTWDDNQRNEAFLSQYPKINGYPHLFVLDSDGKLLHSQDTSSLEEGHGYNEKVYLEFLDRWKPGSAAAQEKQN